MLLCTLPNRKFALWALSLQKKIKGVRSSCILHKYYFSTLFSSDNKNYYETNVSDRFRSTERRQDPVNNRRYPDILVRRCSRSRAGAGRSYAAASKSPEKKNNFRPCSCFLLKLRSGLGLNICPEHLVTFNLRSWYTLLAVCPGSSDPPEKIF